jgi:heme/copper-type cytochrome/quinol oxidase subunit 3
MPESATQGAPIQAARVGTAVFLASWVVVFFALLLSCVAVRLRAPGWPPKTPVFLPALATGAALLSSALLFARRRRAGVVAAALFFAAQLALVIRLLEVGGALLLLTGFHALHAVIGVAGLAASAARPGRGSAPLWAAYWHTLGVAWLCLVAFICYS